jgi:flagellar export protein FliJ
MARFRYQLERILDARKLQAEREEALYEQKLAAVRQQQRQAQAFAESAERNEYAPSPAADVEAPPYERVSDWRFTVRRDLQRMQEAVQQLQAEAEQQRMKLVEARRAVRLLEKLREQRHAEWEKEEERKVTEIAADNYLANLQRRVQAARRYA